MKNLIFLLSQPRIKEEGRNYLNNLKVNYGSTLSSNQQGSLNKTKNITTSSLVLSNNLNP